MLRTVAASPWLLPVAIALGVHALWLTGSTVTDRPARPVPGLRTADNTPELLRFSSRASQAASPAVGLGTLTLPFENSLPPPPPELAGGPLPPPAGGVAGGNQVGKPVARTPAETAVGPKGSLAWGVDSVPGRGLPADAATALALAAQLDAPADSPGQGGQQEPNVKPDGPSREEGSKQAQAALARRHLRLGAAGDRPYRLLWDSGSTPTTRPESLAGLPDGVEVRRLPLATARAMGLAQPHGVSVASPSGLLLLWVQGDDLWLIRQPPGAPTGTS